MLSERPFRSILTAVPLSAAGSVSASSGHDPAGRLVAQGDGDVGVLGGHAQGPSVEDGGVRHADGVAGHGVTGVGTGCRPLAQPPQPATRRLRSRARSVRE